MKQDSAYTEKGLTGGAGIALFVIFGILPGIYMGGITGLKMADILFGASANLDLFRGLLTTSGMMVGITAGATVYAMAGSILRWLINALLSSHRAGKNGGHRGHGMPGCHPA